LKPFSKEHITNLKDRFNSLAGSFLSDDHICNAHIELKREHTLMVCEEIKSLAEEINLSQEKIRLAYVIALFHDIGRFEQFYRFRTFDDSQSLNHAALSVDIIKSDGYLDSIPENLHELIFRAILNHNIPFYQVPENNETTLFSKLLRDADKLDILRVVTRDDLRKLVEGKDQSDIYEVSDMILRKFQDHQIVTVDLVRSLNDLRLVRIGWIFDINFHATYEKIKERKFLEKLIRLIPKSEKTVEIQSIVQEYMEQKMPPA
jgi:putative nucleotidyltransferase with HDIG domain